MLWATADLSTVPERVAPARPSLTTGFRWQLAPGVSYQGLVKMLAQWQDELLAAVGAQFRERRPDVPQAQWETAG